MEKTASTKTETKKDTPKKKAKAKAKSKEAAEKAPVEKAKPLEKPDLVIIQDAIKKYAPDFGDKVTQSMTGQLIDIAVDTGRTDEEGVRFVAREYWSLPE